MGCPSSLIIDTSGGQSSKDIFVSFLFSCQVGGSTSLESSAHLRKKVSLQHWHLGNWGFLNQNSKIDNHGSWMSKIHWFPMLAQGWISCGTCSYLELTEDHVLTSAYVKFFRTVTRSAVNKSVWRKKNCSWLPLNKHAMNFWLSSLRIRAHLCWRTGKHLHVLHVLRTYSTCSYPG